MEIDRGAKHGRVSPMAFVRECSIFREETRARAEKIDTRL